MERLPAIDQLRPLPTPNLREAVFSLVSTHRIFLYSGLTATSVLFYNRRRQIRACLIQLGSSIGIYCCVRISRMWTSQFTFEHIQALQTNVGLLQDILTQKGVTEKNSQKFGEKLVQALDANRIESINSLLKAANYRTLAPVIPMNWSLQPTALVELEVLLQSGDSQTICDHLNQYSNFYRALLERRKDFLLNTRLEPDPNRSQSDVRKILFISLIGGWIVARGLKAHSFRLARRWP